MTPRISGHSSIFGLVFFFVLKAPGIGRQMVCENFAVFILKPWSYVRIFSYIKLGLFIASG